ncbi:conserved protein, unknown function, partial [Hepatocystis sp. ex Piliocolobus tephrosceles]
MYKNDSSSNNNNNSSSSSINSNKYNNNIAKNAKDIYNDNVTDSSRFRSIPYESIYDINSNKNSNYNNNNGNSTCRSSRVSNMYFNDSARRSISAIPNMNNLSRRNSNMYMCEDDVYNNNNDNTNSNNNNNKNLDENNSYRMLEKDKEYLIEKRKLFLEREKDAYERIRQNNNYAYANMPRYE